MGVAHGPLLAAAVLDHDDARFMGRPRDHFINHLRHLALQEHDTRVLYDFSGPRRVAFVEVPAVIRALVHHA